MTAQNVEWNEMKRTEWDLRDCKTSQRDGIQKRWKLNQTEWISQEME